MTGVSARYAGHRPDAMSLRATFRSHSGGLGRDVGARSGRVLAAARAGVGNASGTLLATLRREYGTNARGPYVDVVGGLEGLTPYHGYHLYGTGPHIIRARRRKALRFVAGGQVIFRRSVHHPGTRANPYLQRALQAAR